MNLAKLNLTEIQDDELQKIEGGSILLCLAVVAIGAAVGAAIGYGIAYVALHLGEE